MDLTVKLWWIVCSYSQYFLWNVGCKSNNVEYSLGDSSMKFCFSQMELASWVWCWNAWLFGYICIFQRELEDEDVFLHMYMCILAVATQLWKYQGWNWTFNHIGYIDRTLAISNKNMKSWFIFIFHAGQWDRVLKKRLELCLLQ